MEGGGRNEIGLSSQERARYARHLALPSIGEGGQRRLKAACVLIVGAGGLGSASSLYLAGAGVGRIGIVDDDVVALSNLQRQVLHGTDSLGRPKTASARSRLLNLNSDIEAVAYPIRFTRDSAAEIARSYDVIVDGTDNFETRYVINETCLHLGIPYVYGAVSGLDGQASLLCLSDGPCYRCLFPQAPTGSVPEGILGAIPGVIGAIQATETIKHIVGIGRPLIGRLLVFDGAAMRFEDILVDKNPDCPWCGAGRLRGS